jgi:electron transfer flavoprotein beta subunit
MKILVLLRMNPDPDGALELKADGSGLDREWMDLKLNEFDDHALEEAVLLKEATAGSVIAVAVGDGAQRTADGDRARRDIRNRDRMAGRGDDPHARDRPNCGRPCT